MKRLADIVFASLGLLVLSPLFVFLAFIIGLTSKGPVFYKQVRIGKAGKPFNLLKFRSMRIDADKLGQLTVGGRDPRITRVGYFIRQYKLDELPQLINVLKGEMSLVGPRPEVEKYVALYSRDQRKVLRVRPGITDVASIVYSNENELLGQSKDPERTYIEDIMPKKLELNMQFIQNPTFGNYLSIIWATLKKVWS